MGCTTHFAQLCCTFMGGCYLKAYRTTKMASGNDDLLYEDDLGAILAIIEADMFENDEDMESEIVPVSKISRLEKIVHSNASFVKKLVYPKQVYQGKRKQNINITLPLIVPAIGILVV